jgi:hypothetical protein
MVKRPRVLLADEVGLGKTVQAGLVAAELGARGAAAVGCAEWYRPRPLAGTCRKASSNTVSGAPSALKPQTGCARHQLRPIGRRSTAVGVTSRLDAHRAFQILQ